MSCTLDSLKQQRQNILEQINDLSCFRRGTVLARLHSCGKPNCLCQKDPSDKHIQYQWSASINGKTQTKNLHLGPETEKYLNETNVYRNFQELMNQYVLINESIADLQQPKPVSTDKELDALKKKLRKKLPVQQRKKSNASST